MKLEKKTDFRKFYDFLLHQERKQYDTPQAVKSALDLFDDVPIVSRATHNIEDFSKFFCSELDTAGLEAGGAIATINSAEVTPIDLCRFDLYAERHTQIKGQNRSIGGYNTLNPEGWGE